MTNNQQLYNERLTRFKKAVALEKPDRTPMMFSGDGFCAKHMGVKLSEFSKNAEVSSNTILSSIQELGGIDINEVCGLYAPLMGLGNLSKVRFAGRGLEEGSTWQIDETEQMTPEDYDKILNHGFEPFLNEFMATKLDLDLDELYQQLGILAQASQKFIDAGYVVVSEVIGSFEIDYLSGGRTMAKLARDLFRMPEKIEAVMDVISEYHINNLRQQIRQIKPTTVFLGAGRGASEFYSPKVWERFIWKYYKRAADTVIEEGSIVQWHMDGNYERDLAYFTDFPKGTCIFCPDGATNIYKIKEVLGEKVCIRGDVPPALLVLGTTDEVYDYCTRLIRDMGPGFIMGSGCYIPPNAKVENVKAMICAANGK